MHCIMSSEIQMKKPQSALQRFAADSITVSYLLRPAIAATSAAKSSAFFSTPSPLSKRTN